MKVFEIDGKQIAVITPEEEMYLRNLATRIINAWNQIKELVMSKGVHFCRSVALWFEEHAELPPDRLDRKSFVNIRHTKARRFQSQVKLNKPKRILARSCL